MVMHGRRADMGFTLVEVLSALAIFGLLLVASFGSVRVAEKSWSVGSARADQNHDTRASIDFLRRQIASLMPMTFLSPEGETLAFRGDGTSLSFVAPAPEAVAGAGMLTMTVAVRETPEGIDLLLDLAPLDPGAESWSVSGDASRVLLTSRSETARLTYLGAPRANEPVTWHAGWPADAQYFPEAVRIEFGSVADRDAGARVVPQTLHFRIQAERWR